MSSTSHHPEPNDPEGRLDWIDQALVNLDQKSLRRTMRIRQSPHVSGLVQLDGKPFVDFGSNDYLGLAADSRLIEAVRHYVGQHGWGSGASPLVSGYGVLHERLEREIAKFEKTESAVVLATGYAANVAAVTSLAGPGDLIASDELNHASIIDGCRLSRADVMVYRHADANHLAEILVDKRRSANPPRRILIVTDGLFSMDGDFAPLAGLADIAARHDAMLMVDEAHATGVWGPTGRGVAEMLRVEHRVHIRVGTLSKALGSVGGFIAGSQAVVDWIRNSARPYLFSTAQPEAAAAASLAALQVVIDEPDRRAGLIEHATWLRNQIVDAGWKVGPSTSQIIPLLIGSADQALEQSKRLAAAGFFVPAIRPPTVPANSSRLRISLSSTHSRKQLESLVRELGQGHAGTRSA